MRPGITGLWQVRNRMKNVSVLDMIEDDIEYIRNFSLLFDIKIAYLTLTKIVEPPVPKMHDPTRMISKQRPKAEGGE